MQQLTADQKKYLAWGAGFLALYFFGPGLMRSCRQAQMPVQAAVQNKPVYVEHGPHQLAPSQNESDPKQAADALVSPGTFAGKWAGQTMLERQGRCILQMEIRQQPDKTFLGFPALSCISMNPYLDGMSGKKFDPQEYIKTLQKPNPATAVLVGAFENGAVEFRVDRITSTNGCQWSSWTVVPYGSNSITAQWRDTCGGGSILLERQPNPR